MINKLKKINFHDLEVEKLELDFIKKIILLETLIYDEKFQDYIDVKIEFKELSDVSFDNFFNDKDFSIEEISSFDLIENNSYRAEFVFLQGFSKPSCRLTFNFVGCTIK